MNIKVLVVDDFPMVRSGICEFVKLDEELEVVAEASSGSAAVELARRLRPEAVLMDLRLPDMDGLEATRIIRQELPETKVLVLSGSTRPSDLEAAIAAGVSGYLSKMIEPEDLTKAIKRAVQGAGGIIVAQEVVPVLVKFLQQTGKPGLAAAGRLEVSRMVAPENLTRREVEILGLLAKGKSNKEIALSLGMSDKTVKVHVSMLLAKFGMQSRTELAVYGAKLFKKEAVGQG